MAVVNPPRLVPDVLREYGGITCAALREYLPSREPRRHLYDLLSDYPLRGGKRMRPSLCIATARAFGGRLEDALATAVAIEMLHNALLIHDDIEDESEERRGKPTLHLLHGIPLALNVGDMLTLMSLRPLIENRTRLGPRLAMQVIEETERMARESAEGQAMELGWRRDNTLGVDDADYLLMVLKKTCWLASIHPCRVGALLGTQGAISGDGLEPFLRFGFFLGAAFQIHDDLLNLTGDAGKYGKELGGDLWEGKRTLMLMHLYREAAPAEKDRIAELLPVPRERKRTADVRWLRRRMDACGSIDYARHIAHGLAGAALHEFSLLYGGLPDSRDKRFIEGMVTWVFERES
jgi:geranylgeranyl diphosphate synthase type II